MPREGTFLFKTGKQFLSSHAEPYPPPKPGRISHTPSKSNTPGAYVLQPKHPQTATARDSDTRPWQNLDGSCLLSTGPKVPPGGRICCLKSWSILFARTPAAPAKKPPRTKSHPCLPGKKQKDIPGVPTHHSSQAHLPRNKRLPFPALRSSPTRNHRNSFQNCHLGSRIRGAHTSRQNLTVCSCKCVKTPGGQTCCHAKR